MPHAAFIRELLSRDDHPSLVIPEGEEIILDSNTEEENLYLHRLVLDSFEDFQALGLIPEHLSEEDLKAAILADDEANFALAQDQIRGANFHSKSSCSCQKSSSLISAEIPEQTFSEALRGKYKRLRKAYNPNLARLMTTVTGRPHEWDDILAAQLRGVYKQMTGGTYKQIQKETLILTAIMRDLTVSPAATLTLQPDVTHFFAGDVRIFVSGKIQCQGSYHKIVCKSFEGNIS